MEQAPPAITQTVNRIVERTVEKVVPTAIAGEGQVAAATNVVTEKIVTVRESDLIARAVAAVEPSVVRLYAPGKDEAGKTIELFVGIGIVTHTDGVIVADVGTPDLGLTAVRSDGVSVPVVVIARPQGATTINIQAPTTTKEMVDGKEETRQLVWNPASFASSAPRLGEAVVAIGGRTSTRLADGIITAISDKNEHTSRGLVETSISTDALLAGSPLIDVEGKIIGIATRVSRENGGFLASSVIALYNANTEGQATAPEAAN